jgi:murein L,D-transpeptidase YcbB/YkuD
MKYIILLPLCIFCIVILSCNNNGDTKKDVKNDDTGAVNVDQKIDTADRGKSMTKRDLSITKENAFNDMFLDSMAMERYIARRGLSDKQIGVRIRSFYNARNYQYAWFASDGPTESARFFWNQYDYALNHLKDTTLTNDAFSKKAEKYLNQEKLTVGTGDSSILGTEFGFTENFIRYVNSTYAKGYVKRKEQEKFIPIKKTDPLEMADSLLNKKHKDDKYYENVNEMYGALKKQLALYYSVAKAGGWPAIPTVKGTLKKGSSNAAVPLIKKRLQLTQDMPGNDTSTLFTDSLELAVQRFQQRHGNKPDGMVNAVLVKEMNVPANQRLMQILLNIDRMRWMPQKPQGNLIIVNIPEFILRVFDGSKTLFEMPVVVGREGNNTMMFNGDLSQIIFSPYWNIPQSIVEKEILPAIKRNPHYLESKNMEYNGNSIRQRPGPDNALGKVKFIFPNSFNMYFHDTPSKGLFKEDKRAFSHGCIRLSDPLKMAEWLLRNDPEWDTEKIVAAMNAGVEKPVKLKEKVPVFIIYYTAWVDQNGLLNFRDDVYGHDTELMARMFNSASVPDPVTVHRVDNMKAVVSH